jgi:hypothetical protein
MKKPRVEKMPAVFLWVAAGLFSPFGIEGSEHKENACFKTAAAVKNMFRFEPLMRAAVKGTYF